MKILFILLISGLIAFSTYEIIQLIGLIKSRKNAKSVKKGELNEDEHFN